jgi:hypothetical protein
MAATCSVQGRPQSTHLRSTSAAGAGAGGGSRAGRDMGASLVVGKGEGVGGAGPVSTRSGGFAAVAFGERASAQL